MTDPPPASVINAQASASPQDFTPPASDHQTTAIGLESPTTIQEPPRTWGRAFRQIGPGLILAASIVGTGEVVNATALGAKAGFALLWLILFSCVIKVFLQIELGRYALIHGQTTLKAFDTLPGPRIGRGSWLGWAWFVMTLLTQAQVASMEGLVGQAAHLAFPEVSHSLQRIAPDPLSEWLTAHPEGPWAILTAMAAVALLWSGGYKRLETITTILVAAVTFLTIVWLVGLQFTKNAIPLREVAGGLIPLVPAGTVLLAFSAFGITGVGASELIAYPYWCLEKGYGRAVGPRDDSDAWARRAKGWFAVLRLDAWFSMVVFTVATVAFYLLGASVLSRLDKIPEGADMVRTLSEMYLEPLRAAGLDWLAPITRIGFLIGVWAVLFKTLYVATAANARLTVDHLDLNSLWTVQNETDRRRKIRVLTTFYPLMALGIYLISPEPLLLVAIGGAAQALMLPIIAVATLALRYRGADPRLAPSRLTDLLVRIAALSTFAVAGFAVYRLIFD